MSKNYKLKSIRVKNNLKQMDIANAIGIPVSTYCQKENGQRKFTLEEAWEISKFLEEKIDDIFFCNFNSQNENKILSNNNIDPKITNKSKGGKENE
ncbi:helix-turn-helix transcriptional regulator [uncultured Clostridium sp.]|uniref:helix-turn-helix transcriptional regulator n=1 Tax=uncultured Clostridium sp. TaxID=59620 RepID=UPI00342CCBCF